MNVLLVVLSFLAAAPAGETVDAPGASEPVALEAPEGVILLDNMTLHYGPVEFDHTLHVEMSGFEGGCASCHHEKTEASDEVLSCRECHAPRTADSEIGMIGLKAAYHRQCLDCHTEWAHENACGFCHMPSGGANSDEAARNLLAYHDRAGRHAKAEETYVYHTRHEPLPVATFHHADHAEKFGLSCVDCHHGSSCSDCHGSGSVDYTMDHRMGTCFQCHDWQSCTDCHDNVEKPRFDHATTANWTLEPNHADMGCTSCHADDRRFDAPTSDRCKACHRVGTGEAFDHAALGVPLLGDHAHIDCVQCHRGRLHIGATADCAACHADKHFPEDLPGRIINAQ